MLTAAYKALVELAAGYLTGIIYYTFSPSLYSATLDSIIH